MASATAQAGVRYGGGLHCRRTTLSLPELRTLRLRGMGLMLRRSKRRPGYAESDLLTAQTVIDEDRYMGQLTFGHAMHRLRIELSGDAVSAEVAVRSRVNGVVKLLTGEAEVSMESSVDRSFRK